MAERALTLRLQVVDQATPALTNYKNAVANAKVATDQLGATTTQASGAFSNLGNVLFSAAAGFAALKLANTVLELNELGQQISITSQGFTALSGGTKKAAELMDMLRNSTGGAVDNLTLMSGASRLMAMGLTESNEMTAKLVGGAVKLAAVFGTEAGPAIEDFSLMLANQSYLRLDTFGLSSARVRERVKELADEFPGLDKAIRFSMATAEEMDRALNRLGDAADASATGIRKLETHWGNFVQGAGSEINRWLEGAAETVGMLLELERIARETQQEIATGGEDLDATARHVTDAWNRMVSGWNPEHLPLAELDMFRAILAEIGTWAVQHGGQVPTVEDLVGFAGFNPRLVEFALEHRFELEEQLEIESQLLEIETRRAEYAEAIAEATDKKRASEALSLAQGFVTGGMDTLRSLVTGDEGIGEELHETYGRALDAATEAAKEQQRATEENTRALMAQAQAISDTIARMMGWSPPEQRALEGAQRSAVDALGRAGLSQYELDQAMQLGEQLLPQYLEQGMAPSEAAMRAYGIFDTTPGEGSDARYVGANPMDLLQVGAMPNLPGGVPMGIRPNEIGLLPGQPLEMSTEYADPSQQDWWPPAEDVALPNFPGANYYGRLGRYDPRISQFNFPGYVQPEMPPQPMVNQGLGGEWYDAMQNFMQPESPVSFGGMDYDSDVMVIEAAREIAQAVMGLAQGTEGGRGFSLYDTLHGPGQYNVLEQEQRGIYTNPYAPLSVTEAVPNEQSPSVFGGMDYSDLPEYVGEAQEPIAEIAANMTTSAEQASEMTDHWKAAGTSIQASSAGAEKMANAIDRLTGNVQQIQVQLILDAHHFHLQLAEQLSWFQLATGR